MNSSIIDMIRHEAEDFSIEYKGTPVGDLIDNMMFVINHLHDRVIDLEKNRKLLGILIETAPDDYVQWVMEKAEQTE